MPANHLNNECPEEENYHVWCNSVSDNPAGGSMGKMEIMNQQPSNHNPGTRTPTENETRVDLKRSRNGKATINGGGDVELEHEMHILTEKDRRRRMNTMFSSLHALLPQLPSKVDKSTIIDEAINYIETLQTTLQTLEKKRLEKHMNACTVDYNQQSTIASSQQVPVALDSSKGAFVADHQGKISSSSMTNFSVTTNMPNFPPPHPASFHTWFSPNVVVNMNGDDAHITVCSPKIPGSFTTTIYILGKHHLNVVSAHISSDKHRSMFMIHAHATVGANSGQFQGALSAEERFKLAVGEMNLWLSARGLMNA